MCAIKSGGKIAVAYYDTDNCQIRMMEDVAETQDYHFLQLSMLILLCWWGRGVCLYPAIQSYAPVLG